MFCWGGLCYDCLFVVFCSIDLVFCVFGFGYLLVLVLVVLACGFRVIMNVPDGLCVVVILLLCFVLVFGFCERFVGLFLRCVGLVLLAGYLICFVLGFGFCSLEILILLMIVYGVWVGLGCLLLVCFLLCALGCCMVPWMVVFVYLFHIGICEFGFSVFGYFGVWNSL